jgi:hypothetical protein
MSHKLRVTCTCLNVGDMFTIKTGDWRSLWVREQCLLVELRSCTMTETLRGLYSMAYLWLDRRWTHRARLAFPEGTTLHLGEQFIVYLEELLNGLGGLGAPNDANAQFTFFEPYEGETSSKNWHQDREYYASLPVEESKGIMVGLLCGIALAFMHRDAIYRLTFAEAHPRCVGRIIKWCQMHLGETYYSTERVNMATHRQRVVREVVDNREGPAWDRQVRPYDPRYSPPPPRRTQAQAPRQASPQEQEGEVPVIDVSIGPEIPPVERGGISAGVRRSTRLQRTTPVDAKRKGKKSKSYLTCGISPALPYLRF